MKQIILTFLIPVHLFSAIALSGPGEEWIKLPSLLRHLAEHRLETPELSFFDFLDQHYGEAFGSHRSAHDHSGHDHGAGRGLVVLPATAATAEGLTQQVEPAVRAFAEQAHTVDCEGLRDLRREVRAVVRADAAVGARSLQPI